MPSDAIGSAARRKRRQPMLMPPSKRITISATTPIRSTVRMSGTTTGMAAAATRKSAGAGIGKRSLNLRRKHREHDAGGDREDDCAEVSDLGHG